MSSAESRFFGLIIFFMSLIYLQSCDLIGDDCGCEETTIPVQSGVYVNAAGDASVEVRRDDATALITRGASVETWRIVRVEPTYRDGDL